MKVKFGIKRYYKTLEGWFIQLLPGDEIVEKNHLKPRIKKYRDFDCPIAGPFRTKHAMEVWMKGFLSFYAKPDTRKKSYISDKLVFPDTNTLYL